MTLSFTGRKRLRKNFGKIQEIAHMPNLIEVQRTSYDQFLQLEKPDGGRRDEGLEAVFRQVFPIKDFSESSLLDFEFDAMDSVHVRIDRRRKLPATTLLYDLGLTQEEILGYFYSKIAFKRQKDGTWTTPLDQAWMRNAKSQSDWKNAKTGDVILEAGSKITVRALRKLQEEASSPSPSPKTN